MMLKVWVRGFIMLKSACTSKEESCVGETKCT